MNAKIFSRRAFLAGSSGIALAALAHPGQVAADVALIYRLTAAPARVPIFGAARRQTPVWSYNGRVPGPEIRLRQGERVRVEVENRLDEETTVHWHGVRLPNPMDGVPH